MITKAQADRRRRRLISFGWMTAIVILTAALIYWEQTAVLYILSTLGVTALLVVVALADLGGERKSAPDGPAK